MRLADPARLQAGANADPEFRLAARYWNATLSLESPTGVLRVEIAEGRIANCREGEAGQPATITVVAPDDTAGRSSWRPSLAHSIRICSAAVFSTTGSPWPATCSR
jgi:hypothetical protein